MEAVESDEDWELGHAVPPVDPGTRAIVRQARDRSHWHVYQVVSARALWDEILRHCDSDGETAVAFSDRRTEGAFASETAADRSGFCAPAWGTLARGSVNLGALVAAPFSPQARVDEDALRQVTTTAIRFLENSVDCLAALQDPIGFEGLAERRLALGVMGLNTMLQKLGLSYGSNEALRETRRIARLLRDAAYSASISLAKERGSFPAFDPESYGVRDDVQSLPERLRRGIRDHGIRNAALLGVPVEEASACFCGQVTPGIAPVLALRHDLSLCQANGETRSLRCYDGGFLDYCRQNGFDPEEADLEALGPAWATSATLQPERQLAMQSIFQGFADSPVQTTIVLPFDACLSEKAALFQQAHRLGCHGCVTRRPQEQLPGRRPGQLRALTVDGHASGRESANEQSLLGNVTYRALWPPLDADLFVTIFDEIADSGERRPCDITIRCEPIPNMAGLPSVAKALSYALRGGSSEMVETLLSDLEGIVAPRGAWIRGRRVRSLPGLIASVVRGHLAGLEGPARTPRLLQS